MGVRNDRDGLPIDCSLEERSASDGTKWRRRGVRWESGTTETDCPSTVHWRSAAPLTEQNGGKGVIKLSAATSTAREDEGTKTVTQ